MRDPREIPIEPLVVEVTEAERAKLAATKGGYITRLGTAEHEQFEALAERGLVKLVMDTGDGASWKLSGDGYALASDALLAER